MRKVGYKVSISIRLCLQAKSYAYGHLIPDLSHEPVKIEMCTNNVYYLRPTFETSIRKLIFRFT